MRVRSWYRRAFSIAIADCAAIPSTIRSSSAENIPGSGWPKNSPPATSPSLVITGTAR